MCYQCHNILVLYMQASSKLMAKYERYSQLRDMAVVCDSCEAYFYSPMNHNRHTYVKVKNGRELNKEEKERRTRREKLEPYWNKV